MLGDALSYPRNSSDWIPTILIGGVLSVLGILVVPAFVVQGYLLRVLRSAAKDETAAPSFTDWGGLIVDGIKLFVVNVAYALVVVVPMIGLSVVLGLGNAVASAGGEPSAAANLLTGALGLLFVLVVTLLGIAVGYFVPAAYANFAVEENLGAAFDFSTIFAAATTSEYFVAWLLAVVVGVVGGLLGSALSILVVGVFVLFYVQVVSYYLWGRGFAEGLGKKRRAVAETDY
jgi:hypothetical protein